MPSNWSVFDVFANILPGAMLLAVLARGAERIGWIESDTISTWNTTYVLVAGIPLSYFAGLLLLPGGRTLVQFAFGRGRGWRQALVEEHASHYPELSGRPHLELDPPILLTLVRLRHPEYGREVLRLAALGVMLRNTAIPLGLGGVLALAEAIADGDWAVRITVAVLLLGSAALAVSASRTRSKMAYLHTLEAAAWMPEADKLAVRQAS
jgi:hypothetical protein